MIALLVTLVLHADPSLQRALDRAATVPGARVELRSFKAPACRGPWEVPPIEASGRVPVRVRSSRCDEWAWATVKVLAPGAVLSADVRSGEPLLGRWTTAELEVRRGITPLSSVDPSATAARAMRRGQPLTPGTVRLGPSPGTPITVRVLVGGVIIEQRATVASCSNGQVCATLPSGRRVTGALDDGALVVSTEGGRL
jgi:hypothetical protein